jgi:hypothetical protein
MTREPRRVRAADQVRVNAPPIPAAKGHAMTTAGEHLLLWIDPRDGIASEGVKANGGAWLLRYYDGAIHDGPCNLDLPENAGSAELVQWVSGQLGYPVSLAKNSSPRRWLPYRLRQCGEGTAYAVIATAASPA